MGQPVRKRQLGLVGHEIREPGRRKLGAPSGRGWGVVNGLEGGFGMRELRQWSLVWN